MLTPLVLVALLAQAEASVPQAAATQSSAAVLTLKEAERRAEAGSPVLAAGRFGAEAAAARVDQAHAALLPQVLLTSGYRYGTGNRPYRIGTRPLPPAPNLLAQSPTTLYDYFSGSLTATQLLYDFGQTTEAWRSSRLSADGAAMDARAIRLAVVLDVRLAFFTALARRGLVEVAREDLANQNRHLAQVTELIAARVRPPIDLVQAKANVGAADLRRIGAENDYSLARADLERAMGGSPVSGDYELASDELPADATEDEASGELFERAASKRPEVASADLQIRAGERGLASIRGTYYPALHLVLSATDAGPFVYPYSFDSSNLRWNYSAGLVLTWPIFEGMRTVGRVREAEALIAQGRAHRTLVDVDLRLEIERARRTVGAAKAAVVVAEATFETARERLRLADERYKAGAGTALEVSDAQVGYASVAAGRVQARYDLAAARAQLAHAIGRSE
jgi:outer membrane protein